MTRDNFSNHFGLLNLRVRTSDIAGKLNYLYLTWELLRDGGFDPDDFVAVYTEDVTNGRLTVELWMKVVRQYDRVVFTLLHRRTTAINLIPSTSGVASYTSGTGTITSTLATIQNPVESYTSSDWIDMGLGAYAASGRVQYRTCGKQIVITGEITVKNEIAKNLSHHKQLQQQHGIFPKSKAALVADGRQPEREYTSERSGIIETILLMYSRSVTALLLVLHCIFR